MAMFTVRLLAPLVVILLTTATMSSSQQCICQWDLENSIDLSSQSFSSLITVLSPGPTCENETRIHELNSEHNFLQKYVPSSTNCFSKVLNLSRNNLTSVPQELLCCKELEEFYIHNNSLTFLNVSTLSRLISLNADFNSLQEFVAPSTNCSLEILNLSYNNLSTLPQELSKCSYLKELKVTNNAIFKFPEVVLQLLTLRPLSRGAFDESPEIYVDLKGNYLPFHLVKRSFKRFSGKVGLLRTYFTPDCACAIVRTYDRQKVSVKYCISAMCTSNPADSLWTFS